MLERQTRDVRLDLFRGLALLIIFVNHVGLNPLAKVTPARFGPSDAAEIFIFISGYAVALAYAPLFAERGFLPSQMKALVRCRQLWVANFLTMLTCGLIVGISVFGGLVSVTDSHRLASFLPLFEQPATALAWHAVLLYLPYAFDILALYIVLIVAAPAYLWLLARFGVAAFLGPVALYAGVQVAPDLSPPNLWGERWNFSPLAWQVVFFLGMTMAFALRGGHRLPRSGALLAAALAILLGMMLWKGAAAEGIRAMLPGGMQAVLPEQGIPLAEKHTLGPMRLLHFLALACAAALLVPRDAKWLRWGPMQLLTNCGRHSLPVFCLGLILSFCGTIVLLKAQGIAAVLAVNLGGMGALILLGLTLERQRTLRRTRRSPVEGRRVSEAL
ncbi:OpgC family protein [Azospirillum doebereinerae]|uniref:OpgC domain-containing protein n=1 Tax=Azospirillum doebereinerae TaxID=92933 RepID=A0A3S0XMC0_9PROT|nr:OpgC domain-containing protein [Azospirillum doebereinerae]RUQ70148.1 OpgC domain-containing protein [Azospirillum doebereinerae]